MTSTEIDSADRVHLAGGAGNTSGAADETDFVIRDREESLPNECAAGLRRVDGQGFAIVSYPEVLNIYRVWIRNA